MSRLIFDLLYLDDFHAGDALFVRSLAQALARMADRRVLILHGPGEHAERALEGEGIFRDRSGGLMPVETPAEHALLERALRHANRKITGAMTDAVVPAVGVIGHERGLFRIVDGQLQAGNVDWIEALARQSVVPVVAAFAADAATGKTGEVTLPLAAEALLEALAMRGRIIFFTKTNLPGIMKTGRSEETVALDELNAAFVADAEAIAHVASKNIPILLTNSTALAASGGPTGTTVRIST